MWYNNSMSDEERLTYKKRCKAMIDAGIDDPISQEGIDFCVDKCPYPQCVVVDSKATSRQVNFRTTSTIAKDLRSHGVSIVDITYILNITRRTVQRYLKK